MRALDQLKAAVNMKPQRKTIELPDGSEFEFWMSPMTLAERGKAQKQAKSDEVTDYALQLLVNKAKDQGGAPLFSPGDVADLRNSLPSSVVEELILQIMIVGPEEEESEELDPKPSSNSSKKTTS